MKIAIFADSFPPHYSGIATYCVELARGLIKKGNRVLVFAPDYSKENVIPEGLEKATIIRLTSFLPPSSTTPIRLSLPSTARVVKNLKSFKPDIIETESPSFLGIDGLVASKILKIPCVSVFHTLTTSKEYLQTLLRTRSKNAEKVSWAYHRWFYNTNNLTLASTDQMVKILTKNRIQRKKIKKVPMFFDFYRVKILKAHQKRALKDVYGLKKKVIVFVGRLGPEKNLDTLIKIWKGIAQKRNDVSLLIVGDGPYQKRMRNEFQKMKVDPHVIFTGHIEHEKLLSSGLLSICNVFVSASISETFGLTSIEAMASKLPVVLFKSQGVAEIVDDTGYVIKKNDIAGFQSSVLKILDSSRLQMKMGTKARKIASKYNVEKSVNKIISAYETAIREYKPTQISLQRLKEKFRDRINLDKYKDFFTLT